MTEKRFTLVKCYNEQWGIVDKSLEKIDQLVLITTSKSGTGYLVSELNKLNEENEQLKKQIGNLEHTRDFCADVCADCKRLEEENEQLKQFPVKLENRIQKLQEDLQKLTEMDTTDLNQQAVQDVATVMGISLNALMEFQKELME